MKSRLLNTLLVSAISTAGVFAQTGSSKTLSLKHGIELEPYGMLWTNTVYETARTNSGDFVFFVFSEDFEGDATYHLDAKSTRLGFRASAPEVCFITCGQVGGQVEVDFQGAFVTENKPGLLLRHAFWHLTGERTRILAGQTWDVISPLNPGMLMYSVGWASGNVGYRRAQIRVEHALARTDLHEVLLQISANANIVSDVSSEPGLTGDHASWPVLEGRLSVSQARLKLGLSGHIGEQLFDFPPQNPGNDEAVETWSGNVDLEVKLTQNVHVRGEAFTGENLGAFLGGILQGVNLNTRRGIASTGGWAELVINSESTALHFGGGVDDPSDDDLTLASQRTRNMMIFANISKRPVPYVLMGIEASYWKTDFVGLSSGESVRVDVATKISL